MKNLIYILLLLISIPVFGQKKISPIQKDYWYAKVGDSVLQNRTTERKAAIDGENFALKHGFQYWRVYPFEYVQYGFVDKPTIVKDSTINVISLDTINITNTALYGFKMIGNKIYFNSKEILNGTSVNGFFLSDDKKAKITGVYINSDALTGHYFTLDRITNYWDVYAIRYEGGSDLTNEKFWLNEVKNGNSEPLPGSTPYFVRTTGSDSNDGLTHQNAFKTINKAVSLQAKTIYVEAGDYGDESINFNYNGTATEPIILQGYKTVTNGVPDEIETNYWTWGNYGIGANAYLDTKELPTLTGSDALRNTTNNNGTAINMPDYCIVKNFQSTKWNKGFNITSSDHIVLKNIVNLYNQCFGSARCCACWSIWWWFVV